MGGWLHSTEVASCFSPRSPGFNSQHSLKIFSGIFQCFRDSLMALHRVIENVNQTHLVAHDVVLQKRQSYSLWLQLSLPYQHHVSKSCQLQLLQQLSGLRYRISFFEKKSFETVQTVALIGNNKNKIFILTSVSAILLLLLFLGPNATAFKKAKFQNL